MSNIKFFAVSAILLIAASITTGCTQNSVADSKASLTDSNNQSAFEIRQDDHVFGNTNAKITLFEYSDFECPYCRSFHTTAELIVKEFGGDVNWVYRHFPLSFHEPAATREAQAAECAADQGNDEKFWEYADLIYSRTSGNGSGINKDTLVDMSEEIGLDSEEFEQCLDSNKFKDKVQQNFNEGAKLGVTGTPATFIYNHETGESEFLSGNQQFDRLKQFIEGKL